jgi:hypothetical protein
MFTYSTSKFPGVSSDAFPPDTGTEYRCSQPSFSHGKTRRSPAAQNSWLSATTAWKALPYPASAFHTWRVTPVFTSATRSDHGSSTWRRGENIRARGAAPWRIQAMRDPSGDHTALPSRSSDGSM